MADLWIAPEKRQINRKKGRCNRKKGRIEKKEKSSGTLASISFQACPRARARKNFKNLFKNLLGCG
jgi:hypothetical protein